MICSVCRWRIRRRSGLCPGAVRLTAQSRACVPWQERRLDHRGDCLRDRSRDLAHADFFLDLHSAGVRFLMPTMVGYDASDARGEAAAKIFGAPVIWAHDVIAPGRSVSAASARGIPWLYTEARGAGRIHPADLEVYRRGIRNLLRHLSILPGEPNTRHPSTFCMATVMWMHRSRPKAAAFWFLKSSCSTQVTAGQRLGTLLDLWGVPQEHFISPRDGVVALIHVCPVVNSNDPLVPDHRSSGLTALFLALLLQVRIISFGDSLTAPRPGVITYTDVSRERFRLK